MRRVLTADELSNTRQKLARLESLYASQESQTGGDVELREMSLDSLGRLITRLREEILWSESHSPTQSRQS